MADASKTIDLIFNGVDKTQAATQAALRNLEAFSGGVTNLAKPISDFTMGAVKLEAGLLASGAAIIAFSVKSAGDFDTAFRQISTLFDATTDDVAAFKVAILDYSKTSSKSLEDITDSIGAAVGSGVKYSDSLALIATAEKLAVATRADLKSTTDVLVSTLNVYGMKTSEAGTVSDLFFQTIKDGKIEMNNLAASLSLVSPVAQVAGVSLKEMLSAIAVLTAQGVAPSTAIEYLRSALSNIIKPSKDAAELAGELGIKFDSASLKSRGLAVTLAEMGSATKGNAEQMNRLVGDAGGFVAVSILAKDGAKALKDELVSMGGATGSTAAAFAKMSDSIDVSRQKVANAFRALTVEIGTPLLDEFGSVANAIAHIFQALGASVKDGALKDLVAYIETQMGGLAAAFTTISNNLPKALAGADFSGFTKGIETLLQAVKSLFGNIDITTVEGLKAVIETTGFAFLGLSQYVAGSIESFKPMFDMLIKMGSGAKDMNTEWFKMGGHLGGIAVQAAAIAPLFTALFAGISTLNAIGGVSVVISGLTVALGSLAAVLSGGVLAAMAGVAGWGFGTMINDAVLTPLLSLATGSKTSLGGVIYDLVHAGDAAKEMGAKSQSGMEKARDEFRKAELAAAALNTGVSGAQEGFRKFELAAQKTDAALEASNKAMIDAANAADKAAAGTGKMADAQAGVLTYAMKTVPVFDAVTGAITGYDQQLVKSATGTIKLGGATDKTADSLKKTADETKKAEEATKKWNEEVAKMKFQEQIKLIEQQTTISVAQIQADSQKITAAFTSINASITSTGEVLGKLYGMFGNPNLSFSDLSKINDQIDKENALRDKSIALQNKMIEATIKEIELRTKAMMNGEALIKIDGAGLQPHLEAFMWEILRTLQVRVNADGLKLLLGT